MFHLGQNGFLTTSDQDCSRNSFSGAQHGELSTKHAAHFYLLRGPTGTADNYLTISINPTYGGYTGVPVNGTSTTLKPWENLSSTSVGKEGETGI